MRKQIDLSEAIGKKITGIAVNRSYQQAILALDDDAFAIVDADTDDPGARVFLLYDLGEVGVNRLGYDQQKLLAALGSETIEAWKSEEREQAAIREAERESMERRHLAELIAKYGVPAQ